jgi:hypothetical protein
MCKLPSFVVKLITWITDAFLNKFSDYSRLKMKPINYVVVAICKLSLEGE